jgi:hypothetical protein
MRIVRILQLIGFFFAMGAILVFIMNVILPFDWDLIASIFFISYLLICGLSFGVAGIIIEHPNLARKYTFEWLLGTVLILIWVLCVYALL